MTRSAWRRGHEGRRAGQSAHRAKPEGRELPHPPERNSSDGPLMKRVCESLGLTLVPHLSDGDAFVDGEFHPLLPILGVFKLIREEAAARLAAGEGDMTVPAFLGSFKRGRRNLPPGVTSRHLLLQLIRNDYAVRVSDLGLAGLLAPDFDGYEENYRVAEGFAEVPRRLAAGTDVRINHEASAVLRHRDGVEVVTNRGVYSANATVVCLPVGVLQAREARFDPPLAREKAVAIDLVNAGTPTKLVLCFRRTRRGRRSGRRPGPCWRRRWPRNSGGPRVGVTRTGGGS